MRLEEQGAFLRWLLEQIQAHTVEVLLVAGDIFDTTTPGSRAQALYYRFLHQLAGSSCRHVVIIGGNHDSPSLLEAPRELLRQLNIHVLGMVDDQLDKEIMLLPGQGAEDPELLVCAVPFLRDRDIRQSGAAETLEEKGRQLRQGIQDHFQQVYQQAEQIRQEYNTQIPLVVMGHLFVAGGQTQEGDGVRELSIGGLDRIDGSSFPAGIDYLALGHLHLPQKVAGNPTRRYSGAPFAMSFSEVGQKKEVLLIDCAEREITPTPLEVPCFQPLASVRGDLSTLLEKIKALKAEERPYWLELQYEGATVIANLREQLLEAVADSQVSILRIRNRRIFDHALQQSKESETLDELSVDEVFARCLEAHQIEPSQRQGLLQAFAEIKRAVAEEDM
jgi:exonuclease SbcD